MQESSSKGTGQRQVPGAGRGGEGRDGGLEWRVLRGRAPTWLGRGQPRGTPRGGERTKDENRGER